MKVAAVLAAVIGSIAVPSVVLAQSACSPTGLSVNLPMLRHANIAYLRFHEETFPDEYVNPYNPSQTFHNIRATMREAINRALLVWNQRCNPSPVLNDQPVLIREASNFLPPAGLENVVLVDIRFKEGFSDKFELCQNFPGQFCHPDAADTQFFGDRIEINIYEKSGREAVPDYTLFDFRDVFERLFKHELGHLLLLGHDYCPNSPMMAEVPDRFGCAPGNPDCEVNPRQEHCDQMEISFEPADPLDKVLAGDPNSLCRLHFYCDRDEGAWIPWAKIRSGCVWFQDVDQAIVETWENGEILIRQTVTTFTNFKCIGGGSNFAPPMTVANSPFLMIAAPSHGVVADSGELEVIGWVWGRGQDLRELRLFVDRQEAVFTAFDFPVSTPAVCNTGVDPAFCDSDSGFVGKLNIYGLAPGVHRLLVVATDLSDDPLPAHLEIEFTVPETFVNHPPTARDDEVFIKLTEGIGPETVIGALANDFDVDGQPISLAGNAIVQYPTQGTLTRIDSNFLQYKPFLWPSGSDSFTYRVVDSLGAPATAEVRIRFMQAIILP